MLSSFSSSNQNFKYVVYVIVIRWLVFNSFPYCWKASDFMIGKAKPYVSGIQLFQVLDFVFFVYGREGHIVMSF